MSVVIGYTDYLLSDNIVPIGEYIDKLDEDYVKEYGKVFFGNEVKKGELTTVLSAISKIKEVRPEDRNNEPGMFEQLIDKYLEEKKVNVDEIDYIIYTRGNPLVGEATDPYYKREKVVPYMIQKKYNMKNATVFSIEQECSATLFAVKLAKSLIDDGSARRVLILSSCFMQYEPLRLMGLFTVNDGAGIMELSKGEEGLEVVDFESVSDGDVARIQDFTVKGEKVIEVGSKVMNTLLERNELSVKDVYIAPQNTHVSTWKLYAKKMNLVNEQIFFDNVARIGHFGDVDIVINLTDIMSKRIVNKDNYILAYAVGTGTTYNAVLLKVLN